MSPANHRANGNALPPARTWWRRLATAPPLAADPSADRPPGPSGPLATDDPAAETVAAPVHRPQEQRVSVEPLGLPPRRPMIKRTLVTISHAIEQAAVAAVATQDEPVILMALFQRPMYFDRERGSYRELARTTTLTVVGVVDSEADVPPGIEGVGLSADEPLAAEWSVVLLTPRAGAALVATDRETIVAGESTIETGRLFDGWYSFHRAHAFQQVVRLQREFGDRLSRRAGIIIDEVLDEAGARLTNPAEQRTDAAVRQLINQLERANARAGALEAELDSAGLRGGTDVLTGLRNRAWLDDYVGRSAGTAGDTLSLAMVRIDIDHLDDVNRWAGRMVGDDLLRHIGMMVTRPLRQVDHAVRLGDDDLLLLLPNTTEEQAGRLAFRLCSEVAALNSYGTQRGGVRATAAVLVTRDRPLPLARLERLLAEGKSRGLPVVVEGQVRQPVAATSPQDALAAGAVVRPYVSAPAPSSPGSPTAAPSPVSSPSIFEPASTPSRGSAVVD